jgi:biopolymer transport protein TolR
MAAGMVGGNGNGRRAASHYRPMSEINVTPLVDVMLVLLVVFMVAAPLLTVGVPVDLPKTQAPAINEQTEPLVITVNAEGKIFVQDTEVPTDSLVPRLVAITDNNPNAVLYVRGDRNINYGRVLEVMSLVSAAGFKKVSLVAESPGAAPAASSGTPAKAAGLAGRPAASAGH